MRPKRVSGPDWILIGALAGVVLFTAAVAYGLVSMIRGDKASQKADQASQKQVVALAPLVLFEGPAFTGTVPPEQPIVVEPAPLAVPASPSGPVQHNTVALHPRAEPAARPPLATKPGSADTASAPAAPKKPAPTQIVIWRVVATANAKPTNLGGNISKVGIVNAMATGHLRDALKAHRNFVRLPASLRSHIENQNIDLRRLAPYRAMVGIDDNRLDAEHGVRFERVVATR